MSKKITAFLMALVMMISMAVTAYSAYDFSLSQDFINDETYKLGDVNSDGAINAMDSLTLKLSLAGRYEGEIDIRAADFDGSNSFGAQDSYSLKLCLSGAKSTAEFEKTQIFRLTIAENDISDYSIVLNEGITDDDNSYVAALILKKYVKKLTGVDLPISYGSSVTAKAIYINQIDLSSERGRELGVEGLYYEVKDGDLYIEGTLRGTMYAVYEILEEYLGVRFFSDDATFVYKQRVVNIEDGTKDEIIPRITFRVSRQTPSRSGALHFYLANRLNGDYLSGFDEKRFGTLTGPIFSNAHSFLEYWKMGNGTYPENTEGMTEVQILESKYNSGTAPNAYTWQPCATSEDTYQKLFQGMLECNRMGMLWGNTPFIEEGVTLFSFSILDNQNYCTCRKCTSISKKEGFSGLYLQLYNRACVDVQQYYPGLRLFGIVYAKDFPKTIKPDENLVILYCGIGCNNHILGMEDCYEQGGQLNNMNNNNDLYALNFWGDLCLETGAELWFWVYPVTYHYYLVGCPNILNLYYNIKYLMDECNVTGIFYEGGGPTYNFEALKEYMTIKLMSDPDMTYEEYTALMKEFLYINYGNGYEELHEYILMQTEAGDQCGTCFINNFDRPGDMYSYEYLAENYDYMRSLLTTAYEKAKTDDQRNRIQTLLVCCDFMGLSSVHTEWYTEGKNQALYMQRYDFMYNYIKNNNMRVFSDAIYTLPSKIDYTVNPMIQFYEYGSRRPEVYP